MSDHDRVVERQGGVLVDVYDPGMLERDSARRIAGLPPEPSDPALFTWFEDLRLRPELLTAPPIVIPRLAWQGRLTVLSADVKLGKSTLAGQGVAAMQTGQPFLDGYAAPGRVLWLGLDEPVGDLVLRLESFGARGGIAIRDLVPTEGQLLDILVGVTPILIVVDSLTEYLGSRQVESVYDPVQVQRALAPLRNAARKLDVAVLFLHHVAKSSGKSADSRQIGAMCDVLMTMAEVPGEPTDRTIECKGRGIPAAFRQYRLRYEDCAYQLVGGAELTTEARVLLAVQDGSGPSKARIRERVGGRRDVVDEAISTLEYRGAIVNRGTAVAGKYYPSCSPEHLGDGRGGARSGRGSGRGADEAANSFGANNGRGGGAVEGRAPGPPSIGGAPGRGAVTSPENEFPGW